MTWDPMITQRVLAAIDKSDDPHLHIDILREELNRQSEAMQVMARDIKLLQDAERDRLTETSVIRTVKEEFSNREINWMKWAVRAVLAGVGTALLGGAGWVIKLAWKGLMK
jgi:hypothetical protein